MRKLLRTVLACAMAAALAAGCSARQDAEPVQSDAASAPTAEESSSTIMPVSQNAEDQLARIVRPLAVHMYQGAQTTIQLQDVPNAEVTNYLFDGILDWQEVYDPKNTNAWTGEPTVNVRIGPLDFTLSPLTDQSEIPEVWGNKYNINPAAPAYALDATAIEQVMSSVLGKPVTTEEIMAGLTDYAGLDASQIVLQDNTILAPYLIDSACWNLAFLSEKRDGDTVDVSYLFDLGDEGTENSMTMHLVPDETSIFGARVESVTVPALDAD